MSFIYKAPNMSYVSFHPEKFTTHLRLYAEDMVRYANKFPMNDDDMNMVIWGIEDRACNSLLVLFPESVKKMVKSSPFLALTPLAEFDVSDVEKISQSDQKKLIHYNEIRLLIAIIATTCDIRDRYKENKIVLRSLFSDLMNYVNEFYESVLAHFPQPTITEEEPDSKEVASAKAVEKNIEWFAMLCDQLKVDDKMPARILWNEIKRESSPEKPIRFGGYQVVLHEDALFYSYFPMTPKEWRECFGNVNAEKIVRKTFENYLSRYKKNLPASPKSIK